jgi:preprotein translocase subunit SecD
MLEKQIKELQTKEQQLLLEMKKKSDLARQLLINKDDEIGKLKKSLTETKIPSTVAVNGSSSTQEHVESSTANRVQQSHRSKASFSSPQKEKSHPQQLSEQQHLLPTSQKKKVDELLSVEEVTNPVFLRFVSFFIVCFSRSVL